MTAPTLRDALMDLRRERRLREGVYPKWVRAGKLTQRLADWQIACLDRAINEISERVEALETTERLL